MEQMVAKGQLQPAERDEVVASSTRSSRRSRISGRWRADGKAKRAEKPQELPRTSRGASRRSPGEGGHAQAEFEAEIKAAKLAELVKLENTKGVLPLEEVQKLNAKPALDDLRRRRPRAPAGFRSKAMGDLHVTAAHHGGFGAACWRPRRPHRALAVHLGARRLPRGRRAMESADEFNNCEWRDDNACDETLSGACGRAPTAGTATTAVLRGHATARRRRLSCWFVGDGTCDEVAGGWCPMCTDCSDCGGCG